MVTFIRTSTGRRHSSGIVKHPATNISEATCPNSVTSLAAALVARATVRPTFRARSANPVLRQFEGELRVGRAIGDSAVSVAGDEAGDTDDGGHNAGEDENDENQ